MEMEIWRELTGEQLNWPCVGTVGFIARKRPQCMQFPIEREEMVTSEASEMLRVKV
jgi:hypothetical protein